MSSYRYRKTRRITLTLGECFDHGRAIAHGKAPNLLAAVFTEHLKATPPTACSLPTHLKHSHTDKIKEGKI